MVINYTIIRNDDSSFVFFTDLAGKPDVPVAIWTTSNHCEKNDIVVFENRSPYSVIK
jgi:hypothetical protein